MPTVTGIWNSKQKELNECLSDPSTFMRGITLCASLHAQVHDLASPEASPTIYQEFLENLPMTAVGFRPPHRFASIAWDLWHITRIEDAVASILLADEAPVLNDSWLRKMNSSIRDTGNAFTTEDVDDLDEKIVGEELFKYRKAVGKRTQKILGELTESDRRRKPKRQQLDRIIEEGVLTPHKDSIWLLDFWGKKTVALLLQMPITRHQIVHLNECLKLKAAYLKRAL